MSMHHASHSGNGSGNAYVVVPPRASDVLSRALRDAYRAPDAEIDPFADLLRELDRIDNEPRRN